MEWAPVSKERFEIILAEETAALSPEVRRVYERYAVAPFPQPCFRDEGYGIESMFVVAKNGNRVLFYDDVEEDFGVAAADADGVIRDWGNYGPLVAAVLALEKSS